jgi:putative DNA primase/helicase
MAHVSAIDVARKANGKRGVDRSFLISCPVPGHGRGRGDLTPSCAIRDGHDGRLLFHCFAGCDWRDVVRAARELGWIDHNSASPSRLSFLPTHWRPHASKAQATKTAEIARQIWKKASQLEGSPAQRYLVQARRIPNPPLGRLRFHPRVWHSDVKKHMPALVAPIFRADREELQGVHIVYLLPTGAGKATAQPPKRTLGRLKGGGVWLGDVMDTVVVAEGIETALSVQCATSIPSVATLSAHTMASLMLPGRVRSVIIAADLGHVGERCAYDAAERWTCRGLTVRIARPGGW